MRLNLILRGQLLARGQEDRFRVRFGAVVVDLDDRPRQRDARRGGGDPYIRIAQQLLELTDAGLLLSLLLAGRVVSAVLLEVALFAAFVDLRGDDGTIGDQTVQFRLEPVVGLLRQPGLLRVGHLDRSLNHSWPLAGTVSSVRRAAAMRLRPATASPVTT